MREPATRDTQIKRFHRMLVIGAVLAALGLAATVSLPGTLQVDFSFASNPNATDEPSWRAIVCVLGTSLVLPLGIGTVAAALTGILFLRRFSLRALLIAALAAACSLTAWITIIRPWLGDSLKIVDGSLVVAIDYSQRSASPYLASGFLSFPLTPIAVLASVPLLLTPIFLFWPSRKRNKTTDSAVIKESSTPPRP